MSLEVDCYKLKRQQGSVLEESFSISSGQFGCIQFLRNIRLLVRHEEEGRSGNVLIAGQNPRLRLSIMLYRDNNDEKGKIVFLDEPNMPIWLEGDQILSIATRRRPYKALFDQEVLIYLGSDDDSDDLPVNAPDPTRDLVLV